jgi:hypothetical protein
MIMLITIDRTDLVYNQFGAYRYVTCVFVFLIFPLVFAHGFLGNYGAPLKS